jgi:Kelch motif
LVIRFNLNGNMTTGRSGNSATVLPDGRVLIAGGDIGSHLGTAEIYDPSTGTFTATGNMVNPQALHAATLLDNGKVLITEGK